MPAAVAEVVVMLSVEEPLPPAIDDGTNEALAPVGSPLALKATVSVKPPLGVIVVV